MSLFFASLNSGSNGNCYYVGTDTDAILIDAGISCRETERRMKKLGLSMSIVRAIFISHEHIDHITGVPGLSKKYQLPVYITTDTLRNSHIPVEEKLVHHFSRARPVIIGGLIVNALSKSHDAADPHSFLISFNNLKVGVFTDIGFACKEVIRCFNQCHAAFLEANYCEEMLENGGYPWHLKKRISCDKGHLSNAQALDLFINYRATHLSHLLLSHLSKNNNTHEKVNSLFSPHAKNTQIIIASRYRETPVFCIETRQASPGTHRKRDRAPQNVQLSLFAEINQNA